MIRRFQVIRTSLPVGQGPLSLYGAVPEQVRPFVTWQGRRQHFDVTQTTLVVGGDNLGRYGTRDMLQKTEYILNENIIADPLIDSIYLEIAMINYPLWIII